MFVRERRQHFVCSVKTFRWTNTHCLHPPGLCTLDTCISIFNDQALGIWDLAAFEQVGQRFFATDAAQVLIVLLPREGYPLFVRQPLPGLVVIFRRIGQNTIKIENDSFWSLHDTEFSLILIFTRY